jgi:hypothetical protein
MEIERDIEGARGRGILRETDMVREMYMEMVEVEINEGR